MPPALLDRSAPAADVPRHRRSLLLVPALLLLGVALLATWVLRGLWPALPFGSQQVDRSTPPLLTSLADLEEYHAATGSFQVVVDLEKDVRWVPSLISGERTTFLATGSVDAVVDFTGLGSTAVTVDEQRRSVVFSLPAARLDEADVDLENSRVLSRDRGVLDRVGGMFSDNPTGERQVASLAEDELDAAAAESDLRERAEDNTREMLTGLARSLGYTAIEVRFDAGDGV
jgi:hypothetical protein